MTGFLLRQLEDEATALRDGGGGDVDLGSPGAHQRRRAGHDRVVHVQQTVVVASVRLKHSSQNRIFHYTTCLNDSTTHRRRNGLQVEFVGADVIADTHGRRRGGHHRAVTAGGDVIDDLNVVVVVILLVQRRLTTFLYKLM